MKVREKVSFDGIDNEGHVLVSRREAKTGKTFCWRIRANKENLVFDKYGNYQIDIAAESALVSIPTTTEIIA